MSTWFVALVAVGLALGVLTGCDGGRSGEGRRTIHVPGDAATITEAVAEAQPGDLVLVQPGVYRETVEVRTERVTLRGVDRNRVVIDGETTRANGVVLSAARTAVQNLTVRNATLNGVLVTARADEYDRLGSPPLEGFLVDHVTSHNNGLYGIYAFNARHGVIQHSYASGAADAGIYVGRCKPCSIAVHGNVAERNAIGFEATNASGPLYVYGNRFVGNRVGATTNSQRQEAFVPQEGAEIAGNVIAANGETLTPAQAEGGFGIGLGIGGGTQNTVSRNLIVANPVAGLVIASAGDLPPVGNQIVANSFTANGIDVVYSATATAPGSENCLHGNTLASVLPAWFATSCPAPGEPSAGVAVPGGPAPPGIASSAVQGPPPLANLPDAPTVGPPATAGLPGPVDLTTIGVPRPELLQDQSSARW